MDQAIESQTVRGLACASSTEASDSTLIQVSSASVGKNAAFAIALQNTLVNSVRKSKSYFKGHSSPLPTLLFQFTVSTDYIYLLCFEQGGVGSSEFGQG